MSTEIYARQGDLVIEKITIAPAEAKAMKPVANYVFAGDSSGHPHTLRGTALVSRDGAVTRLRLAEAAELTHGKAGGHKTVSFVPGDFEVRPLRERGGQGDRNVVD